MSLFHSLLVLLLLFSAPFGEPADSYFPLKDSWHTGELSKNIAKPSHWADAIPCPQRKSAPPFLGKRQQQQQQQQQQQRQQGMPPGKSRVVSVPQGALLMEQENDLSTYNWNSFGLRYGKRQALQTKEKL